MSATVTAGADVREGEQKSGGHAEKDRARLWSRRVRWRESNSHRRRDLIRCPSAPSGFANSCTALHVGGARAIVLTEIRCICMSCMRCRVGGVAQW